MIRRPCVQYALQSLEKALDQTEVGLEELCDRTSVMDEHLKSVQSELSYTQQRVASKVKEVKSEAHLKSLSEREAARHIADVKTLNKERTGLVDRVMILQNQIYRANEKMDQFKVWPALLPVCFSFCYRLE
jgi:coiled-coil domain-containing protein 39